MKRSEAVKKINRAICGVAKGLFTDEFWEGKNLVEKALRKVCDLNSLDYTMKGSEYQHNQEGQPVAKRWFYEVVVGGPRAYPVQVIVIAAGAGSVYDPLLKYDMVAYAS